MSDNPPQIPAAPPAAADTVKLQFVLNDGDAGASDVTPIRDPKRAVPAVPYAAAAAVLPTIKCPPYHDGDNIVQFIKRCEYFLTQHNVPRDKWPFYMGEALTDSAKPLWDAFISSDDPALYDYKLFKQELLDQFAGTDTEHLRYFSLLDLVQGSRSFTEFYAAWQRLTVGLSLPSPFDMVFFARGLNRREKATALKHSSVKAAVAALRAEEIARQNAPSTSSGYKYNSGPRSRQPPPGPSGNSGSSQRSAQLNSIEAVAASFPRDKRLPAFLREYYDAKGCKFCRTTDHFYEHCQARFEAESYARAAENGQRQ